MSSPWVGKDRAALAAHVARRTAERKRAPRGLWLESFDRVNTTRAQAAPGRWLYVQALVDPALVADEDPCGIEFWTVTLDAKDEDDAYVRGAEAVERQEGHEAARGGKLMNDYVVRL